MKYITGILLWFLGVLIFGFVCRIHYQFFMLGWGLL
jgi:hypothetical protein